eukprot:SAG31_NODE_1251_length_9110_cov_5.844412_8_plen_51_part_00
MIRLTFDKLRISNKVIINQAESLNLVLEYPEYFSSTRYIFLKNVLQVLKY